jgi:hypothetical protein
LQDSLYFPEYRIVFVREKLWTKFTSHGPQAPLVHHGPAPWPTSGAHRSSASATPGLKVTGEGAGEVEEAAVSTFVGSSELGSWGNGGAVEREDRRRSVLGGAVFRCGRGGERGGEGCGITLGWRWSFIGSGGVRRGGTGKKCSPLMAAMMPAFRAH